MARTESGSIQASQARVFLGRVAQVRLRQGHQKADPRRARGARLSALRRENRGRGVNVMSMAPAILVTGGASGIGFAVAEAVLAEGWRAICADASERNLAWAHEKLGHRAELRFERFDVADEAAVVRAVAACESEFGP